MVHNDESGEEWMGKEKYRYTTRFIAFGPSTKSISLSPLKTLSFFFSWKYFLKALSQRMSIQCSTYSIGCKIPSEVSQSMSMVQDSSNKMSSPQPPLPTTTNKKMIEL